MQFAVPSSGLRTENGGCMLPLPCLALQTQLDGLLDTRQKLVEGFRLCVTTAQGGNSRHIVAAFIPLQDHL